MGKDGTKRSYRGGGKKKRLGGDQGGSRDALGKLTLPSNNGGNCPTPNTRGDGQLPIHGALIMAGKAQGEGKKNKRGTKDYSQN